MSKQYQKQKLKWRMEGYNKALEDLKRKVREECKSFGSMWISRYSVNRLATKLNKKQGEKNK